MHLIISWYVYPLSLILIGLLIIRSLQLPPQVKPLTQADLAVSAEYYNRIMRKGTFTPRHLTPVVDWRVEEKV